MANPTIPRIRATVQPDRAAAVVHSSLVHVGPPSPLLAGEIVDLSPGTATNVAYECSRPLTDHNERPYRLVSDKIVHISASKYCPLLDINDRP